MKNTIRTACGMKRCTKIRIGAGIAAALLLITEILIGLFAHGFVRGSVGDVLVVMLLWAVWRTVSPERPAFGLLLPAGIFLFACGVEFLQLWGFCDRLHIENRLLRTLIGTGFSVRDLFCYAAGILPLLFTEHLLKKRLTVQIHYTTRRGKCKGSAPDAFLHKSVKL